MTTYVISGGETLDGTTVTGGGPVTSVVLSPGDNLLVSSGGDVTNIALAGDTISVANNGSASDLAVNSGGVAILTGGAVVSGVTVTSGGVLSASGGNLTGAVINSGGTLKQPSGTLTNPVTVSNGANIVFNGPGPNVTYTSGLSGGNEQVTVTSNAGTHLSQTVTLLGTGYGFSSTTSGVKPQIIITATCYAAGTQIQTKRGAVAVEAIQLHDKVVVRRDGQDVLEPVVWIGRSTIDLGRHSHPERVAPIRIRAGALADNVPLRDLVVSPEHCLILDGRCIPAKLLVNGRGIVREYRHEPFQYYHLELEKHGILIAEGAEAESYLDTGNRSSFDNAEMPRLLHPVFEVNAASILWQTEACAPLATADDDVAPIWQALADRSAAMGFAAPQTVVTTDADLHVLADGVPIQPAAEHNSHFLFTVPAGIASVCLVSRIFIPADRMIASERDTRRLGVRVESIAIRYGDHETVLQADAASLRNGWYDIETVGPATWRWTDGAAFIPWEDVEGAAVLTVHCTVADCYLVAEQAVRLVA